MNETRALSPTDRLAESEEEKVRIEIALLKRPAYKRIGFWTGIVVPLVALTASIITGELTGFFDDQLAKLKQEKRELRSQVELMNTSVQVLKANNASLNQEKEQVERERDQLVQAKKDLEDDKAMLHGELSNLNAAIQAHQATVKELKAEARQFGEDAQAATDELETLFHDLDRLLGEKGELYTLVEETPMDATRKQELRDRLLQHLRTIQATQTHLIEVKAILERMKAAAE